MTKKVSFLLAVLILSFAAGIFIFAWTEPSTAPPGNNVPAPINVGSEPQAKAGSLSVTILYDTDNPSYYLNPAGSSTVSSLCLGGNCRSTWPATVVSQPSGYDYDVITSPLIKYGDIPCPIWKDCDGDGYTYSSGDCDENCATCYSGSTFSTPEPDGRDQDCDGVIDEPESVVWGYDSHCNWIPSGSYRYTNSITSCETHSVDCSCKKISNQASYLHTINCGGETWSEWQNAGGYAYRCVSTRYK